MRKIFLEKNDEMGLVFIARPYCGFNNNIFLIDTGKLNK
jgi:hypothetical protein